MIPSGVAVYFAAEPVDLRCGIDRLSGFAAERVGYDARGGALFVFVGKRRTALKILFFDGSGMCLFYKRLDRGTFRLPDDREPDATHIEIDEATLDALLDGVAVEAAAPRKPRPTMHGDRSRAIRPFHNGQAGSPCRKPTFAWDAARRLLQLRRSRSGQRRSRPWCRASWTSSR